MPRLVGALLCRNEATPDRYLRLAVANALSYCDLVVALDDNSTDATVQTLIEMGCEVETRSQVNVGGFWGIDEASPRARLWALATERAGPDGWIYVFDADHELVGVTPKEVRTYLTSDNVTAWALPLWDCWDSPDQMRVDGYWQAAKHPRPWFFRAQPTRGFVADWSTIDRKGVHTGHSPPNAPWVIGEMRGAAIRHHGYINPEHRKSKAAKYLALV